MNRVKASIYNIGASILQQFVSVAFGFVSRMLFVHVLGVEILGLNNTFESVLGSLALAELGIQRAIAYSLYKPFKENDLNKINSIMTIYMWFYRVVAVIVFIGSVICIPILPQIITGFEFEKIFVLYFMTLALNSTFSYLLAYKRVMFWVDQRDYVTKLIDTGCSSVFLVLKIVVLKTTGSYFGFLLIGLVQTVISNIIVHLLCNLRYPFLKIVALDKNLFKKIWNDMTEIIYGKIASFVYDSTDNLVISAFISTISVGFIGNYVLITSSIKKLINSIVNPLAPIIGRMIADGDSSAKRRSFELCTQFCFLVSMVLLVPTFGLINPLISIWLGNYYVLEITIPLLLVIDLFMFTMQGICYSYIFGEGLFKLEKCVDIITAAMNLILSILLAKIIGLHGIYIGTIISELAMWIGRSYIVYFRSMFLTNKEYLRYILKNILRFVTFIISICISYFIGNNSFTSYGIVNLLIGGLLCECEVLLIFILCFGWMAETKELKSIIVRVLRRKMC